MYTLILWLRSKKGTKAKREAQHLHISAVTGIKQYKTI